MKTFNNASINVGCQPTQKAINIGFKPTLNNLNKIVLCLCHLGLLILTILYYSFNNIMWLHLKKILLTNCASVERKKIMALPLRIEF